MTRIPLALPVPGPAPPTSNTNSIAILDTPPILATLDDELASILNKLKN